MNSAPGPARLFSKCSVRCKLFLNYFSQKQLVGLYLLGGLGAGICFIAAYNIFPYFENEVNKSFLLGASGSIMAIILAIALYIPNFEIQLLFIGKIKLKWIAMAMILISVFNTTSSNAGGEFAHIGGALIGIIYMYLYKKGKAKGSFTQFDFAGSALSYSVQTRT